MISFLTSSNPGFYIFGMHVAWYGVIMACSILLAIVLCCVNAKQRGRKYDEIITLALFAVPLAIIFARIYFVVFYARDYSFVEMLRIWDGGMAIYGGVIGGALGVGLYCLIFKKNFLDLGDIIIPGLIVAQATGRWGNFVNKEAYGSLITDTSKQWFPYAVEIPSERFTSVATEEVVEAYGSVQSSAWFNATFFYESMWNLIGFVILMVLLYKVKNRGVCIATYFLYYGLGRFLIEGLRTDSLYLFNTGIRVSQGISLLLMIAGFVWLTVIVVLELKKKGIILKNRKKKEITK